MTPPDGYSPLPAGVACRCPRGWTDGTQHFCCNGAGAAANQQSAPEAEVAAQPPKRTKFNNVGAPKCFALETACKQVAEAFNAFGGYGGLYVVGSVLERPDWRDVDVRLILDDVEFAKLFPQAGQHWEFDPRWLLMTVSISEHLSRVTGLPIDFQFQPRTHANDRHKGNRNPIGMRFAPEPQPSAAPATGANKEHAP